MIVVVVEVKWGWGGDELCRMTETGVFKYGNNNKLLAWPEGEPLYRNAGMGPFVAKARDERCINGVRIFFQIFSLVVFYSKLRKCGYYFNYNIYFSK